MQINSLSGSQQSRIDFLISDFWTERHQIDSIVQVGSSAREQGAGVLLSEVLVDVGRVGLLDLCF